MRIHEPGLAEPEGIGCCSELDTFQAEAAAAIVKNKGARVSGRGGVGKTKQIELLAADFKALKYDVDIIAATHVQAQVAGGETILSRLPKNSRCKERCIIVDELSMVNITTWAYLAEAAFVGCIFVVLGDEAQRPPIGEDLNRCKHLSQSDAIHDLTNGLHVQLRKFRRRRRPTSTG